MPCAAWPPLRPFVGGLAVLALVALNGREYLGLSLPLSNRALAVLGGMPNFAGVTAPHQRYEGLRIERINYSATSVSAQLKVRDWGAVNFPRQLFDRARYPALHG